MTTVYFATNRAPEINAIGGFGNQISPLVTYGAAKIAANGSAVIDPRQQPDHWVDGMATEIIAAGKPILVSIHGFEYSFTDALARAALISTLINPAGADPVVIAFCWPSQDQLIKLPDLSGAYFDDQKMAAASAQAIAAFFKEIGLLRDNIRLQNGAAGTGRTVLLCHSMGNYALAGALDHVDRQDIFDDTILAAADEGWDSFALADGSRFGRLNLISRRQTIYLSHKDQVLHMSGLFFVNDLQRLGYDGPKNRLENAGQFPPDQFRLINCSPFDFETLDPDDSHQYYRMAQKVLADIASVVLGAAGPVPAPGPLDETD